MRNKRRSMLAETRGVDLNPMMGIVFILLIFFIVTATFTVEAGLDVDPPDPTTERPPDEVTAILVTIDAADDVTVAGRRTDIRRVGAALTAKWAVLPDAPVVVRSAPEATNGAFVRVLDQARRAGAVIRIASGDPDSGGSEVDTPGI